MRGVPFFCEIKEGLLGKGVKKKNQEASSHTDLSLEKVYMNVDDPETDYLSYSGITQKPSCLQTGRLLP